MKAEEFLKEQYSNFNSWKNYPPSESKVVEMLEQFANQRVIEELEMIDTCFPISKKDLENRIKELKQG